VAEPVPTSFIVLVDRDGTPPVALTASLERALGGAGALEEAVVAISDRAPAIHAELDRQRLSDARLLILPLSHWFDPAAAIQRALPMTTGGTVATMRLDDLCVADALPDLVDALDRAHVAALTTPPASRLARVIGELPDRFVQRIFGVPFALVLSTLRVHRRPVLERVADRSVPLALQPLVVAWQGGRVAARPRPGGRDRPTTARAALGNAVLTPLLYFLLSFTRRPLHLFGMAGAAAGIVGALITLPLITDRLIHGVPLADEPMLIPGLLLCAMGVQSAAIGLLAELLVFARARTLKDDIGEQLLD
jgi:hypothetical protein